MSTMLQYAPQRCQTFPNSLSAYAYVHTMPYMGLCLQYYYLHNKNHTYEIGLATCIKSCMCPSFRQFPSDDAYVLHARSASGICICQLHFEKMQDSIIGSFVFLEFGCVIYYLAVEVPKRPKQIPMVLEQNLEKRIEPADETGLV